MSKKAKRKNKQGPLSYGTKAPAPLPPRSTAPKKSTKYFWVSLLFALITVIGAFWFMKQEDQTYSSVLLVPVGISLVCSVFYGKTRRAERRG